MLQAFVSFLGSLVHILATAFLFGGRLPPPLFDPVAGSVTTAEAERDALDKTTSTALRVLSVANTAYYASCFLVLSSSLFASSASVVVLVVLSLVLSLVHGLLCLALLTGRTLVEEVRLPESSTNPLRNGVLATSFVNTGTQLLFFFLLASMVWEVPRIKA
jgi:hypothetical protein